MKASRGHGAQKKRRVAVASALIVPLSALALMIAYKPDDRPVVSQLTETQFGDIVSSEPDQKLHTEKAVALVEPAAVSKSSEGEEALPFERPLVIEGPQSESISYLNGDGKNPESVELSFSEIAVAYPADIELFEPTLVSHGKTLQLGGDLLNIPEGSKVAIDIGNVSIEGVAEAVKFDDDYGTRHQLITFPGAGFYMTIFKGSNIIAGKVYAPEGSYMYEINGKTGFYMSVYEYKKLNNALMYD